MDRVAVERKGPVATVRIARPDRYNAFDVETVGEIRRALESVSEDDAVRSVLLTGEGSAFCAGGDTDEMLEALDDGAPDRLFKELTRHLHAAIVETRRMPKPVVAAVNGAAAGGGFGLALAADIRVASEDAFFLPAYFEIGVVPDGGITWFLPRIVGRGRAFEILLRDRRVPADEAAEIGLVDRVVPGDELLPAARDLAGELADGPPIAVAEAKALLDRSLERSLEAQLERERRANAASARTDDFAEGLRAYHGDRDPDFEGR